MTNNMSLCFGYSYNAVIQTPIIENKVCLCVKLVIYVF